MAFYACKQMCTCMNNIDFESIQIISTRTSLKVRYCVRINYMPIIISKVCNACKQMLLQQYLSIQGKECLTVLYRQSVCFACL